MSNIKIPQPALALNAVHVPGWDYEMQENIKVGDTEEARDIVRQTVDVAKKHDGYLYAVVFNCHASPGELKMGRGFYRGNVKHFAGLTAEDGEGNRIPRVGLICLIACFVADIKKPGSETDGNLFCAEIARNSQAYVLAPQGDQHPPSKRTPKGEIDKFEGTVVLYSPLGTCRVWKGESLFVPRRYGNG